MTRVQCSKMEIKYNIVCFYILLLCQEIERSFIHLPDESNFLPFLRFFDWILKMFRQVDNCGFSFYWTTLFGVTISLFPVYCMLNKITWKTQGYTGAIQHCFQKRTYIGF